MVSVRIDWEEDHKLNCKMKDHKLEVTVKICQSSRFGSYLHFAKLLGLMRAKCSLNRRWVA